ncbi:MAG TPA: TlpA disulfide reductase family protein [Pedomonas sp.]|uniref:TlpA family protein disulfide reductase n=1 Tax=Pedomonas sp. TaxID=2976421 RepID=UPI002F4025FC
MTLPLGPLMLAVDRFIALAAIALFLAVCGWIARRAGYADKGRRAALIAVIAGIIAARAGFVISNLAAYAPDPWTVFYVWQGGFSAVWGVTAGAAALLLTWRGPEQRKALAALAVIALVWFGLERFTVQSQSQPFPETLAITRLTGQPLALDSLRGKPFVINLWATWCPPCRREMPMLIDVAADMPGTPILLVNQGEPVSTVIRYLHREQLGAQAIMLDPKSRMSAALDISAYPATLFVDATGTIRQIHTGEISRAALLSGLRLIGAPTGQYAG